MASDRSDYCRYLSVNSTKGKELIDIAYLCNGSCDQEPRLWNHGVNLVRAAVLARETLFNFRPSHKWSSGLEHCDFVQEISFQGYRH